MTKASLTESEAFTIIKQLDLKAVCTEKTEYYDNETKKSTHDGFYIRVTFRTSGKPCLKLEIETSIHKYWCKYTTGFFSNYSLFTIEDAKEAIANLLEKIGIGTDGIMVNDYEIGLNLWLNDDCINYTDKIQTIGAGKNLKDFKENKKFRQRREIITLFHKDVRKYFKMYDKCFEMREKRKVDLPEHLNILRIESVIRRAKLSLDEFVSPKHLQKDCIQFKKDWDSLQFDKELITPKGTFLQDIEFCKEVLQTNIEEFKSKTQANFKSGVLSERQKRTRNEFIKTRWNELKSKIKMIKCKEELEFRAAFENNYYLAKF